MNIDEVYAKIQKNGIISLITDGGARLRTSHIGDDVNLILLTVIVKIRNLKHSQSLRGLPAFHASVAPYPGQPFSLPHSIP